MNRPIIRPRIVYRVGNNRQELIGGEMGISDGASVFPVNTFVVLTAGILVAVASAGAAACGFCQDASKATTAIDPPTQFFGDKHFPINLKGMVFAISVTDATGHVGEADGAPQLSEVTIGEKYGLLRLTSGTYDGYQFLNVDDTTADFFEVVEKPTTFDGIGQLATAYNPIVFVRILDSAIQAVG